MFIRLLGTTILLFANPTWGQFGVAMKGKKVGTSFEELNEIMKERDGSGADAVGDGGESWGDMLTGALKDPRMKEALENMGDTMQKAMDQISQMSPEELQDQMQQAMKLMTDGGVMENVLSKKGEVLQTLKQTGLVSEDELAKYEADPAYFEEQMKVAFDQMQGIFTNPEVLKQTANAMKELKDVAENPIVKQMQEILVADSVSPVQIEELRQRLLENPEALTSNTILKAMFAESEFETSLQSQETFAEEINTAREKLQELKNLGAEALGGGLGQGAGVGEL